jgi:hypothetical protein
MTTHIVNILAILAMGATAAVFFYMGTDRYKNNKDTASQVWTIRVILLGSAALQFLNLLLWHPK